MDNRIRTSISIGLKSASILTEESVRSYPEAALREIFLNAIMHRDYMSNTPVRFYVFSDRIEIQNPGGLFGEVTRDTLTERNSYRNPIIAEAMKNLGYVNRFGYGIQRAESALSKNGNPPLEFEIDDRSFLVKIRRRQPLKS
jgi:ATP-dependent DNA helicase RecG